MKTFLTFAILAGAIAAHAETYVCKQPQDQGGKTVVTVSLDQNGTATLQFGEDQVAYGTYTKTEGQCPSRLCGNFNIEIDAEVPNPQPMEVDMIHGQIIQQNVLQIGSLTFYYQGGRAPSHDIVECALSED